MDVTTCLVTTCLAPCDVVRYFKIEITFYYAIANRIKKNTFLHYYVNDNAKVKCDRVQFLVTSLVIGYKFRKKTGTAHFLAKNIQFHNNFEYYSP